jgi:hypothetical protein
MGHFLEYILWSFLDTSKDISIVWSSLVISKKNSQDNYLISKFN